MALVTCAPSARAGETCTHGIITSTGKVISNSDDYCSFHQLEKTPPVTRMDTDAPDLIGGQDDPHLIGGQDAPDLMGGQDAPDLMGGQDAPDLMGGQKERQASCLSTV